MSHLMTIVALQKKKKEIAAWIGFFSLPQINGIDRIVPETKDKSAILIQTQTGDFFEQRQHFHFANLSNV